ncbi:GDSL-type esterase/lipase family protein [Micromonospora parva]|uniref:GDSL-type esterase/lipase family protein n=1 Tax=Micromonospora parva TaxID=1464048 RepID=UPI0033EB2D5C
MPLALALAVTGVSQSPASAANKPSTPSTQVVEVGSSKATSDDDPARANTSFPVSGTLADKDGSPIREANLAVYLDPSPAMQKDSAPAEGIRLANTRTNSRGEFRLKVPALKNIDAYVDRKGQVTLQFMSFGDQHSLLYQQQVKLPSKAGEPARAAVADRNVYPDQSRVATMAVLGGRVTPALTGMNLTAATKPTKSTKQTAATSGFPDIDYEGECNRVWGQIPWGSYWWVKEGDPIKTWVPVQRAQTADKTTMKYEWGNSEETSTEIAVNFENTHVTVGGGFADLTASGSGVNFEVGHNVVRDLEVEYDFYKHRLWCSISGDVTNRRPVGITKALPDSFAGGNRNSTYSGYYQCPNVGYRSEINNPLWVSRASTTTLTGSASAFGISLAAQQVNSSSHKKTYTPVTKPAYLCGEDGNPVATEKVSEVNGDGTGGGGGGGGANPRIMVVGDSISQGHEGDYTWRYRLKQHLSQSGQTVDFVGPYRGTTYVPTAQPDDFPDTTAPAKFDGSYRGGMTFDSDHFAQWGRQAGQAKNDVRARVADYKPDYLLVELGFNDIAWGATNSDGLITDMRILIQEARRSNPDLRILVANVVKRTPLPNAPQLPGITNEYNSRIGSLLASLDTSMSPVRLVDINSEIDPALHAYDGLHPNGLGEYRIARAFANVLSSSFSLGGTFGSIPASVPDLTPARPGWINASPTTSGIKVSWEHSYAAGGYWFYQRDVTAGQAFQRSALQIPADSWHANWLQSGHQYEFYVVPTHGDTSGPASAVVAATGSFTTASGPTGIVATPGSGYADVQWDPPTGSYSGTVSGYRVYFVDESISGGFLDSVRTSGTSARIPNLINGHRYGMVIASINAGGEGYPAAAPAVVPGYGRPSAPNLRSARITSRSDVRLSWDAVPGAASYVVMVVNVLDDDPDPYTRYAPVSGTSTDIGWLFDGADLMEWCVIARNGSLESSPSNCLRSRLDPPVLTAAKMTSPSDVQLSWSAAPGASRYYIMNRNVVAGGSWNRYSDPVEGTSKQIGWLFDGASNYEWCIVAATYYIESAPSNCIRSHS